MMLGANLGTMAAAAAEKLENTEGHLENMEGKDKGRLPIHLGSYYEAEVPDTLDLAEHARLGINHFTEAIRQNLDSEMIMGVKYGADHSAKAVMHMTGIACCQAKSMEAMAMERLMSGSQQNLEQEAKMVDMMASHVGKDGIWWVPRDFNANVDEPWLGPRDWRPYANTHGEGRMFRAMIRWYEYTGDERWKVLLDQMVDGLDKKYVVHQDDYAYVPVAGWLPHDYWRSNYTLKGWEDTTEPATEKAGEEGSLMNHQANCAGPPATWYALSGNQQSLRLSGEWVRFLMKPKFWADWKNGDYPGVDGAEHAHWQGHFHGYVNCLRSILDYAVVVKDPGLMAFVRDGYEWSRQQQGAIPQIGKVGDGQGCGLGRLLGVAVKLSYAGVGDYWEDVDQYIRNHAVEYQFKAADIFRLVGQGDGKPIDEYASPDDVFRRLDTSKLRLDSVPSEQGNVPPGMTAMDVIRATIGDIAGSPAKTDSYQCCTGHGNMGFFYAWDGALRREDETVRVNLLVNRASPWMDVDSCLPYEGKVVLKNKNAESAFVRIPLWVNKKGVEARVGQRRVRPEWFGRYLHFESLKSGDVLTVEFPMKERTEAYTSKKTVYTCRFRGNTLVEVSPSMSPLYDGRVEKYSRSQAPMRKVTRFVTPVVYKW
jgi:hypothetical protein